MSALHSLALAASVLALGARPQDAADVTARLVATPVSAEVGEPVVLELVVEHPALLKLSVKTEPFAADESWVVLGSEGLLTRIDAQDRHRATTRATWRVCSLEPGSRELPSLTLDLSDREDDFEVYPSAPLEVRGVLAKGEDEPRPPKEFRPVPGEQVAEAWPWALGAVLAIALAALALFVWRRRAKTSAVNLARPTPLQRLQALESNDLARPEAVQELYYEISHAVREAADLRARRDRSGLTDAEWLGSARAELAPESRTTLEELLRECAEVKYGMARPTHWAARDALSKARVLVAAPELAPGVVEARS